MSEIVAIWLKRARRGPMDPVGDAEALAGRGLVGNSDQGGKRQVTIIAEEAWHEAERELGVEVPPSARRANVMIRGIDLEETRGRMLRLGSTVIRIEGMTRPCERMDEAQPGLRDALEPRWRGGVYGEILEGGRIRIGDGAEFVETVESIGATPENS